MLVLRNALVVTGDGKTMLERASVVVRDGLIAEVAQNLSLPAEGEAEIVDCTGKMILPGMINHHTHGVVLGPFLASGASARSEGQVLKQLDRELLNGHTTVMGVDGFVTMEEVRRTQKLHPVKIRTAAVQLPLSLHAAEIADAMGLTQAHREMTLEKMLEDGAVCIGEVGAGQTTGGGDYVYIPRMVKQRKGVEITTEQSYAMFLSVLGRYADRGYYKRDRVEKALRDCGLGEILTPEECRDIVYETTFRVYHQALDAFEEAVAAAIRLDVPVLLHHTPSTTQCVQRLAKRGARTFVPCHSNCLFTPEEAVEVCGRLREEFGVVIDAAVFDSFSRQVIGPTPDVLYAMLRENLVDVISTDFSGGQADSMLCAVEFAVKTGVVSLPEVVAMCTTNVARAFPGIARGTGMLAKGYRADLLVVNNPELSKLNRVYIDGRLVVCDGARLKGAGQ